MIVLVVIVLAVIGGLWFVVRGRGGSQAPPEVSAHKPTAADDILPAPPAEQGEAGTHDVASPTATLERPESIPGRMQRLRSRLAGSGGFGRAVLSVLSRGDLSEADWEEIEDTLLTSDLGIEVTTALMDELRTQARVLGT